MSDENKAAAEIEADEYLRRLSTQLERKTAAPEPGVPGEMIEKTLDLGGGEHTPLNLRVVDQVESAGYTYVYDRETGEQKVVNNNMLRQQLRKMRRLRDGSLTEVFTTIKPPPDKQPVRGVIKCLLHAGHNDRALWAKYGFAPCYKENLLTEFDLEQHMRIRHGREWEAIQRDRENLEKAEIRAERRALLDLAAANRAPAPSRRGRTALAGDDEPTAA